MASLSQLQASYDNAKSSLDSSISSFNSEVGKYNGGWKTVFDHLFCITPNTPRKWIGKGMDWDSVAVAITNYSDIDKINKNANLSVNSGDFCAAPGSLWGDTPATYSAGSALNNLIQYSLLPIKNAYNNLIAKYAIYTGAKSALESSPDYQGQILAGAQNAKTNTIKWVFFGLIALGLIAATLFFAKMLLAHKSS